MSIYLEILLKEYLRSNSINMFGRDLAQQFASVNITLNVVLPVVHGGPSTVPGFFVSLFV